jgi:V/A-type H+-transporting ATPase subunit E
MTTIDDKVKLFIKIIYEKIDEENSKFIDDFQKQKEFKLAELNRYIKEEKAKVMAETLKKAEIKASEIVTSEKIKGQQQILKLKQEMVLDLVQQVKFRFKNFIEVEEHQYKRYLLEILEGCVENLVNGEYLIFFTEDDIKKYEQDIESIFSNKHIAVSIQASKNDLIGGFIIQQKNGKYRIDYSFLRKIDDNKDLIGLKYIKE